MTYIQRKDTQTGQLETVGEYAKRSEALKDCREYRFTDPYGIYYLSSRACRAWGK